MGSSFSLLNQTTTKTTITAPFDNTAYRFDPRSPTTAFNRTPLKHVASKLKIADLADPRSPAAARTPVRRVLFDNNNDPREPMHNRTPVVAKHGYSLFDPRSPMAGRSPLRPLLSNADPREPMAGRTPLASISATFSDVPTSPSASSRRRQARHTKRALFDADPDDDVLDNQFEQMALLDNDDDNDWFSCYESDDDDNENNDTQFEDTVVSTPDIVQYTPHSSRFASQFQIKFATPRAKLAPRSPFTRLLSDHTKQGRARAGSIGATDGFAHRSRLVMQERLVSSCPSSPHAA